MKKLLLSIIMVSSVLFGAYAGEIKVDGYYQGTSVYVQNPFSPDGEGYCISGITVNGESAKTVISSSAFEIDLSMYSLKVGDKVNVVITHSDDCRPKIVNQNVLQPLSTFTITEIFVSPEGVLNWSTQDEQGKLDYIVEQYRWERWLVIGRTPGSGLPSPPQSYTFDIKNKPINIKPHTGINKYRVRQVDYKGKSRSSLETSYKIKEEPVEITNKKGDEITFSKETSFQVYDKFGNLVAEGSNTTINMSKFEEGKFFINYDAESFKYKKK